VTGSSTPEPGDPLLTNREVLHRHSPNQSTSESQSQISEETKGASTKLFDLTVLDSEAMIKRIGKAMFAEAVERKGYPPQKGPKFWIETVHDVATAIKYYLEDTP
jgi:hypothetical protein